MDLENRPRSRLYLGRRCFQATSFWAMYACNKPAVCGQCGGVSYGEMACPTSDITCVSCGDAHEASSASCPKWKHQKHLIDYAKTNGVDRRRAGSALIQPLNLLTPSEFPLLLRSATELTPKRRSSPVTPLAWLHPPGVNEPRSSVKRLPLPSSVWQRGTCFSRPFRKEPSWAGS